MKKWIISLSGIIVWMAISSGAVQAAPTANLPASQSAAATVSGAVLQSEAKKNVQFQAGAVQATLATKQFTFQIPVDLKNIPADLAGKLRVHAAVYPDGADPMNATPIGEVLVPVGLVNGNFTGTVTAKFDVGGGVKPELAKIYIVMLVLEDYNGASRIPLVEVMGAKPEYYPDTSKPYKFYSYGPIPGASQ